MKHTIIIKPKVNMGDFFITVHYLFNYLICELPEIFPDPSRILRAGSLCIHQDHELGYHENKTTNRKPYILIGCIVICATYKESTNKR